MNQFESTGQEISNGRIEIVSSQESITGCTDDLEDISINLENADVKRASAQVKDRQVVASTSIKSMGQGRSRRFVDDSKTLQTCNLCGISSRLALVIIEVSRHCNDCRLDILTRGLLSNSPHMPKDMRTDLLGRVDPSLHTNPGITRRTRSNSPGHHATDTLDLWRTKAASDQTLYAEDRMLSAAKALLLSPMTHNHSVAPGESDHRRLNPVSIRIGQDNRTTIHNCRNHGIRCSEVNSYCDTHDRSSVVQQI